jgi:hypothetical protein
MSPSMKRLSPGAARTSDGVYTEYEDPRRSFWNTAVIPALHKISLKTWQRETGKSSAILIDARRGRRHPHARNKALLIAVARKCGVLR